MRWLFWFVAQSKRIRLKAKSGKTGERRFVTMVVCTQNVIPSLNAITVCHAAALTSCALVNLPEYNHGFLLSHPHYRNYAAAFTVNRQLPIMAPN